MAPKIVSFLGSATEIVYALGLEAYLVGASHECTYPPEALQLPRVSRSRFDPSGLTSAEIDAAVRRCMMEHGAVYEVDRALLAELRPTLVLTQGLCDVCAVPVGSVQEAVSELGGSTRVLSLDAHSIDQIFETVSAVAEAAGVPGAGTERVDRWRERLATVRRAVANRPRREVLLLEWLDPLFAPGHWVPEMIALAGGRSLLGTAGERSIEVRADEVEGLEPDVILVEPCGYDLDRASADADRHRDLLDRLRSRRSGGCEVWILDSAWFSRSGPRIVEGVEVLGRIFHPESFPRVNLEGRARRWA